MKRIALFILFLLLLLWAIIAVLRPSNVIHVGNFTVPSVKVTRIIPTFEKDGSLWLNADLNMPLKPPCRVIWRFKGENHGYTLESVGGFSAVLYIGEPQARVTVEACIAEGDRSGGCCSITFTSDLLDHAQNEDEWMEFRVPDFSETNRI